MKLDATSYYFISINKSKYLTQKNNGKMNHPSRKVSSSIGVNTK